MASSVSDLMPHVRIGTHNLSRLIIGGNPFSGNSHQDSATDREMRDFHATVRILETLRRAQKWGINAFQSRGDNHMIRLVNDYRLSGGNLKWIAQTASERADIFANIGQIASAGAVGIYHHGSRTDRLWHEGRIAEVLPYLAAIRDTGCLVGLGTHIPEVLAYAEEHGWDVDFYMASLYNLSRPDAPSRTDDRFVESDRELMLAAIRNTSRPVLAFKILGAGRRAREGVSLQSAFAQTLSAIKPNDAVVVGMFTKYGDQVAQNARLVMKLAQNGAPTQEAESNRHPAPAPPL